MELALIVKINLSCAVALPLKTKFFNSNFMVLTFELDMRPLDIYVNFFRKYKYQLKKKLCYNDDVDI